MAEGKTECRYLCSELVRVDYESAPGSVEQFTGNLEEISPTAAVLLLDTSVRRGHALSFSTQNRRLHCVVDSWVYEPAIGYFVSVRFSGGYEWREEHFTPEHFLKLARAERAKGQAS